VPRAARPDDVYRFRVPTEPRLSPDGRWVVATVKVAAPRHDGYRTSLWLAPADGSSEARRLTIGAKGDHHGRFSPDGSTIAFLSDRRLVVEEEPDRGSDNQDREDTVQIHVLRLDGGEATRLTDLPRGVDDFAWSPDGSTLAVLTSSAAADRKEDAKRRGKHLERKPGDPPESDYRYLDRLDYMLNGAGFTYDHVAHLWLVDAATGEARQLVAGPTEEGDVAWSPDGTRLAFTANRRRDHDIVGRSDVFVVDVASGNVTAITGGPDSLFFGPAWSRDGSTIVAAGGRFPHSNYQAGIWRFAADGSDATAAGGTNLLEGSDLMPYSGMNSDVTIGEGGRLLVTGDGRHVLFTAPIRGSYELWRIPIAGGDAERLTEGRHYLSGWDAVPTKAGMRVAAIRSSPTELPEVQVLDVPSRGAAGKLHRVTSLNRELVDEVELRGPTERWWRSDEWDIQGWHYAAESGRQPLVLQIHGGPHTLYGFSPMWEWQVLAGAGISVLGTNPRGSEGYGGAFNRANLNGDWGPGPMRDVLGGVEGLIADGLADPNRLGVTGGSYGGYLTNWIIGHDQRFAAAITCRSVADMSMLFLTGDISGGEWAEIEFGGTPWSRPELFREVSPLTYAKDIRTPLLIQHAERDLRTTVGQAEALFTVLRTFKRQVRFMRVPDESHELTRSGTPFRRAENLVQVRDWFLHYLVKGAKTLPPLPKARAGK
jgi:acylaminoacyl-peptidase